MLGGGAKLGILYQIAVRAEPAPSIEQQ